MTDLKVFVTEPLIERACQRDSRHCMIAEAILAARPHFRGVMVDLQTIRWSNPRTGKRYIAITPQAAASALVAYDHGDPIEPFDLWLRPIQVTAMSRNTETKAEARAAGRTSSRQAHSRGRKALRIDSNGQPKVVGGVALPTGALSNKPRSGAAAPPEDASNVTKSMARYRQFGLRLLKR